MNNKFHDELQLVGRILIAALFVWAGIGKIQHYDGTGMFMASHGLPMVPVLEPLTILTELGGGLLVVLGLYTRPVGILWFLFLIPVTLTFHTTADAIHSAQEQMINVYKNISIMGAALYLVANGAGRLSLDAKLRKV